MSHKVGTKGQLVIEKDLRDQLGVEPGWQTVQRVREGHLEVHFFPPEHDRSLAGSLAQHIKRTAPTHEALQKAREIAWAAAAKDHEAQESER